MAIYCAKCGVMHECSVCPACHGSGRRDETKCVHICNGCYHKIPDVEWRNFKFYLSCPVCGGRSFYVEEQP